MWIQGGEIIEGKLIPDHDGKFLRFIGYLKGKSALMMF